MNWFAGLAATLNSIDAKLTTIACLVAADVVLRIAGVTLLWMRKPVRAACCLHSYRNN